MKKELGKFKHMRALYREKNRRSQSFSGTGHAL